MEKDIDSNENIPEIYCALALGFDENVCTEEIVDSLKKIGILEMKICRPKCGSEIYFDICVVNNERFWYLDDALTKMFSKIECKPQQLKDIVQKFKGTILVDIAFCQYGTYPALEFVGENMKKIRFLEADISIDAY